jgi:hypothetical protein
MDFFDFSLSRSELAFGAGFFELGGCLVLQCGGCGGTADRGPRFHIPNNECVVILSAESSEESIRVRKAHILDLS